MKNKYDLIVVGGGFAGVAAAISAAKKGVDVLLIEKYNALGSAAVNALVMPFMSFWTTDPETEEKKYISGDLFLEIVDEMSKLAGKEKSDERPVNFDEEFLKLVLNRMAVKYGVNLLFNTTVTEALVTDGKITSIQILWKIQAVRVVCGSFY